MDLQTIEVRGMGSRVALLTLNRPDKKNAISVLMRREISAALAELKADAKVGAVIITGAGNAFSAGFDLKEFLQPDLRNDVFESSQQYHHDVWDFPKPIIAAINGVAMGGGFDLATLCDIRVCAPDAKFAHPEIKFGGPPLFTPLQWIVGHGMARDLCLTGRAIDASEALRIGLVSEIIEKDALLEKAASIAKTILQAPDKTLAFVKSYMNKDAARGFDESFALEHDEAFRSAFFG